MMEVNVDYGSLSFLCHYIIHTKNPNQVCVEERARDDNKLTQLSD